MQQIKIWLVILFYQGRNFHAKQIFVLTGIMKLGPDDKDDGNVTLESFYF